MQSIRTLHSPIALPAALQQCLPTHLQDAVLRSGVATIEEIRLRRDRLVSVTSRGRYYSTGVLVSEREINDIFHRMCGGSLYAHEETIRQGFLPLSGGIRVGVCGSAACEGERIIGIHNITSLMIRIPHALQLCVNDLLDPFFQNGTGGGMLIYSPPGVGKTTLLRAIAASAASRYGKNTVVVDTRGELNIDLGDPSLFLDVMSGYPRSVGIEIAVRTLGANLIVCDEIGSMADARATLAAANCGVPLIASAHAASTEELLARPALATLHQARVFAYYVGLSRRGSGGFSYDLTDWQEAGKTMRRLPC